MQKEAKIINIFASLAGIWWGSHPHQLLLYHFSLYRSILWSSIEYGCQVLQLTNNQGIFLKLQRLQFKVIRIVGGYRTCTPINMMLTETKETLLNKRFQYLTSKYLFTKTLPSRIFQHEIVLTLWRTLLGIVFWEGTDERSMPERVYPQTYSSLCPPFNDPSLLFVRL